MKRILQHPVSFFMIITVGFFLLLALLFASLNSNLFWYFGGFILLIPMFEILRYAAYIFNLHCVKTTNNPRKSVRLFKKQINKTKNSLQIFDDGNKIESDGKNSENNEKNKDNEDIYNNPIIMAALKKKIKGNPGFKIDIQFNSVPNENKIFKLAEDFKNNIEIKHNIDSDACKRTGEETHVRISDNGKICHISRHKWGEKERSVTSFKKPFHFNWYLFGLKEEGHENHPVFLSRRIFNRNEQSNKFI